MQESRFLKSAMDRILQAFGLACLLAFSCTVSGADAQQYTWTDVPRIVAISDPHGAYDAMVRTLANADVIDDQTNWAGGQAHLVITGDLLDRGPDSRKIMELVMQLETQALEDGGMVHLLLGNHEVMNLVGDLRYVAPAEFAAFAEDESAEERERWFRIFGAQRLSIVDPDKAALRAEFDKDRPPGFFGHRQAFSSEGKYGKWLMGKPLMVVINGNAFVHGGLPPIVAELGLDGLNSLLGSQISDYVSQLGVLYEAGLLDPALSFYRHPERAESLGVMTTLPAEIDAALRTITDLHGSSVHNREGPLWYRGSVGCSTLVEGDRLNDALRAIGADRVVIGHTPTDTRQVLAKHDGRVIEIDTGMLNTYYRGSGNALVIEDGEISVAHERTADLSRVVHHPRRVGYRAGFLSAANLEYLLTHGEIVSIRTDQQGRKLVEVKDANTTIKALFTEDANSRGLNPNLASYRLDRLLKLDMVPVTVARKVRGDKGSLQFLPENTRTEKYRDSTGQGGAAWCPINEQWRSMYIFDALIYNPGRTATNILYDVESWQLMLPGNDKTFGTNRGRPRYLARARLDVNESWKQVLADLDDEKLATHLGDVLDKRRITALAKRRDGLLAD